MLFLSDLPKLHSSEEEEWGSEVHLMISELSSNDTLPQPRRTSAHVNACPWLPSRVPGDGTD